MCQAVSVHSIAHPNSFFVDDVGGICQGEFFAFIVGDALLGDQAGEFPIRTRLDHTQIKDWD